MGSGLTGTARLALAVAAFAATSMMVTYESRYSTTSTRYTVRERLIEASRPKDWGVMHLRYSWWDRFALRVRIGEYILAQRYREDCNFVRPGRDSPVIFFVRRIWPNAAAGTKGVPLADGIG
jgi:hypothetical protein